MKTMTTTTTTGIVSGSASENVQVAFFCILLFFYPATQHTTLRWHMAYDTITELFIAIYKQEENSLLKAIVRGCIIQIKGQSCPCIYNEYYAQKRTQIMNYPDPATRADHSQKRRPKEKYMSLMTPVRSQIRGQAAPSSPTAPRPNGQKQEKLLLPNAWPDDARHDRPAPKNESVAILDPRRAPHLGGGLAAPAPAPRRATWLQSTVSAYP